MVGVPGASASTSLPILMRRPAVTAVLPFILGILLHSRLPYAPAPYAAGAVALAIASLILLRQRSINCIALAIALICCGAAAAQIQHYAYSANHIAAYTTDQPRLAVIEMRIDQEPRIVSYPFGHFHAPPPRQAARAQVLRVQTTTGWEAASGQIVLQIDQPHPRLALGQVVRAIGHLQRPAPAMNPGQFDWESYYRDERILVSLAIPRANNIEILQQQAAGPIDLLRRHARRLLEQGFAAAQSLDCALLRALTLGDSDPEIRDVQDHFRQSGTAHQLVVSGMHVAVLGGVVLLVLRLLRRHPRTALVGMMIFVTLYALAAMPATPILRSVLLCLAMGLGTMHGQARDMLQLLCLVMLAMLLYAPLDLYNAGFQLSFGTVLGMVALAPRLIEFFGPGFDEHTRVAMSFRRPPLMQRLWLGIRSHAIATISFGVVAWLVSAPLIAIHFEQLNPWAIPGGIVLFPVVFMALVGGLAKILLTLLLPGFAGTWASLAAVPIAWMRHFVSFLAHLPRADVPLPSPPLWIVLIWYALLFLPLAMRLRRQAAAPGRWSKGVQWSVRCAPGAAAAMALFLPLLMGFAPGRSAGDARITLLSIGAGQIAVVQTPAGRAFLIDDGSAWIADPLRSALGPFLRHQGRSHLDAIFLSHPDYDHISAAAATINACDVDTVYVHPYFRRQSQHNAPAEALLAQLDESSHPPTLIQRNQRLQIDPDTVVEVLWPPPNHVFQTTNNAGLVLKLICHGRSVLFPADIQDGAQRELLASPATLKSDVLIAPHHGSSGAATAEFLRIVDPKIVLSSNDRKLSSRQLEFDKLVGARPLYRTHRDGAITLIIHRDGTMDVETFLHSPRR